MTPEKSRISIINTSLVPLTPTRRINPNRACVSTPSRKIRSSSPRIRNHVGLSPSFHHRTTPKSSRNSNHLNGNVASSSSCATSDRFIPNRSRFYPDICRSSIENAEKNLAYTFENLSRRQFDLNNACSITVMAEDGRRDTPQSTPPNRNIETAVSVGSGIEEHHESMTPLQEEFRRRMRGALLNIPLDDTISSRIGNGAIVMANNRDINSNVHAPFNAMASPNSIAVNRENISSIAYASLPDYENGADNATLGVGTSHTNGCRRMLSFRGMKHDESFRSSNGSLGSGDLSSRENSASDIVHCSTPKKIQRQFSASSSTSSSPHFPSSLPLSTEVDPFSHDQLHVLHRVASTNSHQNSLCQTDIEGTRLRSVAKSIGRRIPKTPSRILDAPELVDDYYLNLVSWGTNNTLAVALGQCVYLWGAETGTIRHLLTLKNEEDYVTSVSWATSTGNVNYIAIGTNHNAVQLWDAEAERRLRSLDGHSERVGALSWNQHWLSSGGRDSLIIQHDVRSRNHIVSTYVGHAQEVCGLKWNDEGSTLASGGNENLLCLWDAAMSRRSNSNNSNSLNHFNELDSSTVGPRLQLTHHKAAVKALAWCPFHRGLLASGGGTADRTIKFWNTNSGAVLNSIDTGSQVCSLLWSKHQREICSSHGFSQNQLILWKYPTMNKIQEFKGHTARVLHMDQSPDGGCVVSAAADETLRFWDVFGSPPNERKGHNLTIGNFCGSPMIR